MVFPKLPKVVNFSTLLVTALRVSERLFFLIIIMFVPQGLKSEGLYRISGFTDSLEEVKMAFDKGVCSFYRFLSARNMTIDTTCFDMFT